MLKCMTKIKVKFRTKKNRHEYFTNKMSINKFFFQKIDDEMIGDECTQKL